MDTVFFFVQSFSKVPEKFDRSISTTDFYENPGKISSIFGDGVKVLI